MKIPNGDAALVGRGELQRLRQLGQALAERVEVRAVGEQAVRGGQVLRLVQVISRFGPGDRLGRVPAQLDEVILRFEQGVQGEARGAEYDRGKDKDGVNELVEGLEGPFP